MCLAYGLNIALCEVIVHVYMFCVLSFIQFSPFSEKKHSYLAISRRKNKQYVFLDSSHVFSPDHLYSFTVIIFAYLIFWRFVTVCESNMVHVLVFHKVTWRMVTWLLVQVKYIWIQKSWWCGPDGEYNGMSWKISDYPMQLWCKLFKIVISQFILW